MATLVFNSLGSMLGGPVGGAIGSLVGSQVDGALLGSSRRDGPRLKDLSVSTSHYGQTIPRIFGKMRVAGTIIWATELVEHSEVQGGGKGSPSLNRYSYSANFAVALASRPITGLGRIWADGKLLRGTDGDLKVPGILRIHTGLGDQTCDPLIEAAEGFQHTPAYRDLAYVVFENLDLSEFYNRIPALTFEVIADDDFNLETIIASSLPDIEAPVPLSGLTGYSSEGAPAQDIQTFEQILPLYIDANGDRLRITSSPATEPTILLDEPAITTSDDDFDTDTETGFTRIRTTSSTQTPSILHYYDLSRDYQASVQRAVRQSAQNNPTTIELPATLDAATAKIWIEQAARRMDWSRDRITWRTSQLDPAVVPGALVQLPQVAGQWRIQDWEWRDSGVELTLIRTPPQSAQSTTPPLTDSGRFNPPIDAPNSRTRLTAFELPVGPHSTSYNVAQPVAALSGMHKHWSGAALFADQGDGQLHPLGPSGRRQAILGIVQNALPSASPLVFDRVSQLIVELANPEHTLSSIPLDHWDQNQNLARVGEEILQFFNATALGNGLWQLDGLLRGLAGTESAITTHAAQDDFVLLDSALIPLNASLVGNHTDRTINAMGHADAVLVTSPVHQSGITLNPLPPVHPQRSIAADGTLILSWTRRARGHWTWQNGTDIPLLEQEERYLVLFGAIEFLDASLPSLTSESTVAHWFVTESRIEIPPSTWADLALQMPNGAFYVSQQGTHGLSATTSLGKIF